MSFAEALNSSPNPKAPKINAHMDESGTITFDGLVGPATDSEPDLSPIYEAMGVDPGTMGYRILGKLSFSAWQQSKRTESGDRDIVWLRAYKGTLVPKTGALTAEEFQTILDHPNYSKPKATVSNEASDYYRVTLVGDLQAGKVDLNGGSKALALRVNQANERLAQIYEEEPADTLLYLDPGDAIEGFNSTPAQKHMNDMSLPAQLEFSRRALTSLLLNGKPFFEHTHVATCTSNHSAWRDGAAYLGKPGDDFGIDIHRAVQEAFSLADLPVTWHMPDPWKEYTVLTLDGVTIALTHGHRAKSEQRMMEWWKGQVFADPEVLGDVNIFVNGHWHHPHATVVGPGQWRIQSFSMDGGSSWFTNQTGESSYPGLVTFRINKNTSEVRDLHFVEVLCDPTV